MKKLATLIIAVLLATAADDAGAAPDRESLIGAWEAHIRSLPGTASLESTGDGVYRLADSDLPYEGELKIAGVLVRPAETGGYDTGFSYFGMVDFQLTDLPVERLSSQVYYYWLTDRQTLHFSEEQQAWVSPAAYQASIKAIFGSDNALGPMSFMLNYGIWVLLVGLIVFVFIIASRQSKKSRSLIDETAAINRKARENIERAASLQDELLAIARENRDLQAANNELLEKMLQALSR